MKLIFLSPQLSSLAKDLSQNTSPAQKMEGREEGDLKEEVEKKETGPAEEKKGEEEKDAAVKEEKSGTDQSREQEDGKTVKGLLMPAIITDRERAAEEKDKETPTAAEMADAKAKSEVLDLKKGGSVAPLHTLKSTLTLQLDTMASSSWPLGFKSPTRLYAPTTDQPEWLHELVVVEKCI